jgi:hypothetical protein
VHTLGSWGEVGPPFIFTRYLLLANIALAVCVARVRNRRCTSSSITHNNNVHQITPAKRIVFAKWGRVASAPQSCSCLEKAHLLRNAACPQPRLFLSSKSSSLPRSSATSQTSGCHPSRSYKLDLVHDGQRQQLVMRLRAKIASSDHYISKY